MKGTSLTLSLRLKRTVRTNHINTNYTMMAHGLFTLFGANRLICVSSSLRAPIPHLNAVHFPLRGTCTWGGCMSLVGHVNGRAPAPSSRTRREWRTWLQLHGWVVVQARGLLFSGLRYPVELPEWRGVPAYLRFALSWVCSLWSLLTQ